MNDFALMHILNKCQTMSHLWRLYGDYILHTMCKTISWPWLGGKWVFVAVITETWSSYSSNQLCDNYHCYNLHAWVSKSLSFPKKLLFFLGGGFLHICMRRTQTWSSGSNSINCQGQSVLSNPIYCLLNFMPF